jgi:hypothetical protein
MSESLANQELMRLGQRRKIQLPLQQHHVDRRGIWQVYEIREQWGGADPDSYMHVTRWFKGQYPDRGRASGRQVWLDLLRWAGQDPRPYDDIPSNDPFKLSIEHLFCQSMAGDWKVLKHGLMSLYAVEMWLNNSAEFKGNGSLAERAFLGHRTYQNHLQFMNWLHTGKNYRLPSLAFLQSTACTDTELATPIYLSSGMRVSGLTRQLYLPYGAAAGLRSAHGKRPRNDDDGGDEPRIEDVTEDAAVASPDQLMTKEAQMEVQVSQLKRQIEEQKQELCQVQKVCEAQTREFKEAFCQVQKVCEAQHQEINELKITCKELVALVGTPGCETTRGMDTVSNSTGSNFSNADANSQNVHMQLKDRWLEYASPCENPKDKNSGKCGCTARRLGHNSDEPLYCAVLLHDFYKMHSSKRVGQGQISLMHRLAGLNEFDPKKLVEHLNRSGVSVKMSDSTLFRYRPKNRSLRMRNAALGWHSRASGGYVEE